MSERDATALSGPIFDESTEITFIELIEVCGIESSLVDEMINEGILEPLSGHRDTQSFSYGSIRRTRTVIHLQRDLGLNLAGAALALELLDQISNLQAQLRRR
jgi:chaperone modulatory protein CbpM